MAEGQCFLDNDVADLATESAWDDPGATKRILGSNGTKVKQRRDELDRLSTRREFAHKVRVSERKLRHIENESALVSVDVAARISLCMLLRAS
jgi:hypothetical protein